jgi:hypothetical protein
MLLSMAFTATERERMAVLINNLCFYASQLVIHSSAEISQRALLNLDKIKNECEPLLCAWTKLPASRATIARSE